MAATTISEDYAKRLKAGRGHERFIKLHQQGLVANTIVLDNRGPFALNHDLETNDESVTRALASFIVGQAHFSKNISFAEAGVTLGEFSPFAGLSVASRRLITARESLGWSLIRRPFGLPERGSGDVDSILIEANLAIDAALTDERARTIAEEIDFSKPIFLSLLIPLSEREPKKWLFVANDLRSRVARDFPTVTPIFARGNGAPVPGHPSAYRVQASALWPLPVTPAPIREILAHPLAKRGESSQLISQPTPNRRKRA